MKKAIFLDRDGTINKDEKGYISDPKDLILYPNSFKALRILQKLGYLIFVVTNQSGVARGYFGIDEVEKLNTKMITEFQENDIKIDRVYYSPYHQQGIIKPYNRKHKSRKPDIGMFEQATSEFNFFIKDSFMIGDKYADVVFGKNAGLKTILVLTGNGERSFLKKRQEWKIWPDFICKDILSAALTIRKFRNYREK